MGFLWYCFFYGLGKFKEMNDMCYDVLSIVERGIGFGMDVCFERLDDLELYIEWLRNIVEFVSWLMEVWRKCSLFVSVYEGFVCLDSVG